MNHKTTRRKRPESLTSLNTVHHLISSHPWPKAYEDFRAKPIFLLLILSAMLGAAAGVNSQTVTVDPGALTLGYMNWSPMPGDASGYGGTGGGVWGLADLQANFSGSILTLQPNTNTYVPGNNYWVNADGSGANRMDANIYNETTGSYVGTTLTFNYTVTANTLSSPYSSQAFIKDFAPDYSSFTAATAPLTVGAGSISLLTSTNAGHQHPIRFRDLRPGCKSSHGGDAVFANCRPDGELGRT